MKRLFPIALLLLCVSFSLSSFAPVHRHLSVVKKGNFVTFPITGTFDGKPGTMTYVVTGSGATPSDITFYYPAGSSTVIASGHFTPYSDGSGWIADCAESITGIRYAIYHNMSGWPEYNIEFISKY
jgi:hypothetical protein